MKVKYFHIRLEFKVMIALLIRKHQTTLKQPNLIGYYQPYIHGWTLQSAKYSGLVQQNFYSWAWRIWAIPWQWDENEQKFVAEQSLKKCHILQKETAYILHVLSGFDRGS